MVILRRKLTHIAEDNTYWGQEWLEDASRVRAPELPRARRSNKSYKPSQELRLDKMEMALSLESRATTRLKLTKEESTRELPFPLPPRGKVRYCELPRRS